MLGVDEAPDKGTADNIQDVVTDDKADPVVKNIVETVAKISLSADDGGRGKEVTITGSGFNNGTTAEAFALVERMADGMPVAKADEPDCSMVIAMGESLGTAAVGSDHKFSIAFTVHQDEFKPGMVNYICAEDSEAGNPREASAAKPFELTASISLDPVQANSGDEVTLKARDFGGPLTEISLGPDKTWTAVTTDTDAFSIKTIESNDYTFEVPGGLSGVVQVAAKRGTTRKTADLTVTPSSLTLSLSEVAPNQSIVISGSGFAEKSYIKVSDITIDDQPLVVDESGTENMVIDGATVEVVKTTSTGEFTASVKVWSDSTTDNPALSDGTYEIEVEDAMGFSGSAMITILAPTLMVTPHGRRPPGLHHH